MTERLIAKLDRLGAEAGIDTMTPAIRQFALLVSKDLVAQWPQRPWVGLTSEDYNEIFEKAQTGEHAVQLAEARLRGNNT
jgi:phage gpG-like protein